ncbi:RHS repeat-associated core domain-containing protein [Microbulbifer sp. YPW16]|uniref:RHS repeat-associated core domain-containing protein n=1 Tax=Microbulbifer sp. YPW16 TaxID=2904242 RepID=UPI001E41ED18|nr:RHS repeat-associated core domain-containing protein [Microbulbifer sp. YPW16]UHQ55339.1 hypothetical protein LVE68_17810 [Microbulbifer sp. YPW16]
MQYRAALLFIILVLLCQQAFATISAPSTSNSGSYSVTYSYSTAGFDHLSSLKIIEKKNGTVTRTFDNLSKPSGSISVSVSNTAQYTYELKAMVARCTNIVDAWPMYCGSWAFPSERDGGSDVVNVAFRPNSPGSITFASVEDGGNIDRDGAFSFTWGATSTASKKFTGYQWCQKIGSSWQSESTCPYVSKSTRTRSRSGLTDNAYRYKVRAYSKAGSYYQYSGWTTSAVVTVAKPPADVDTIYNPSGQPLETSFYLSWTAVSGLDQSDRYDLECKPPGKSYGDGLCSNNQVPGDNPTALIELPEGSNGDYSFRVKACTENGCSENWTYRTVSVDVPLTPPDVPEITVPDRVDKLDHTVTWTAPARATSYELKRARLSSPESGCVVNASDGLCWKTVQITEPNSYRAQGGVADQYKYKVQAYNQGVPSGWDESDWFDVHNLENIGELPAVSTEVADQPGTLPYSAEVNTRGDAVVSIPVQAAPGVNGLAPSLSIRYSGSRYRQRANESLPEDILGYGWQIVGGGEIRRCTKNRALYVKIELDDTDSLCLNGEPLVLISGTHWQTGAKYRTLRESFRLVELKETAEGKPWFEVRSPDGRISEYGSSVDSRLKAGRDGEFTPHYGWSLTRVTDPFGNTMVYKYHRDTVQGINYPLEIIYGNGGDAKIEFQYGTRTDAPPQPLDPDQIQQEQLVLLHHIRVSLDEQLQREYLLISEEEPENPDGAPHYRRLLQVQVCGYNEFGTIRECLNPLTFNWSEPQSGDPIDAETGIETVIDGLGRYTHFKHERFGDTDSFDELPFGPLIAPDAAEAQELSQEDGDNRRVVSEVHRSNGLSGRCDILGGTGCHVTTYGYQGRGFMSKKHWGFLGYYAQRVYDTASGIATYRQFRLDFPHFGKTARLHQYMGYFLAHNQTLTKQYFRYGDLSLSVNGKNTHFPFLEESLETVYEGDQTLGYLYSRNSFTKDIFALSDGTSAGELIDSSTQIQKTLTGASVPSSQSYWGEIQSISGSGALRSKKKITGFMNRTSPWLIGFTELEDVSHYKGDTTIAPDRVQTAFAVPHSFSNKLDSITQFPGDARYELNVSYGYDDKGNLTSETVSAPDNADNRLDVATRTATASNFIDGRYPRNLTNAMNQQITVGYDSRFGMASSITDANAQTTSITYDPFGREVSRVNQDNVTFITDYGFCGAGSCPVSGDVEAGYWAETSSAIAPTNSRYYDLLGRLVQEDIQSFDGSSQSRRQYKYDARGLLYSETVPYFSSGGSGIDHFTQYDYDERNRVEKVRKPDASIVDIEYLPLATEHQVLVRVTDNVNDSQGNPLSSQGVQVKESFYSITGDLVKSVDDATGKNVHTRFTYDGSGLLETSVLGSGDIDDPTTESSYVFDHAGYRVSLTDPNLGTVSSLYNALGQLVWQEDNKGQAIDYEYDKLGRPTRQEDAGGVAEWHYDAPNAIGSLESRSYTENGIQVFLESYSYRTDSKLQSISTSLTAGGQSKSYQHQYGYDGFGRLNRVTYPNGIDAYYHFNGQGYLESLSDNAAGSNPLKRFNNVNARGQVEMETYGNGLVTDRTYNAMTGRLNTIKTGGGIVQNNVYAWRSNGTLESRLTNSASGVLQKREEFGYDSLNRLTSASLTAGGTRTLSTRYDDLGNVREKTSSRSGDTNVTGYEYGEFGNAGPNAVSGAAINGVAHSLHYDLNGAITRYDAASGEDKWISWDARQLPTEVVVGDSQSTLSPTARDRFQYGPNGQRFYRESSWMEGGELKTEKAFIVGNYEEIIPLYDDSIDSIQKSSFDSNVVHVALVTDIGTSGEYQYLHRDHLGSIEKVTDQAGSAYIELSKSFDPDGKRRAADWSGELSQQELTELLQSQGLTTRRGFTGHEHLDRTGLIHMNGRIYDPALGRFLSPDPIVQEPTYSQSWNRYSYVFNSPMSLTDPSGYNANDVKDETMPIDCGSCEHVEVTGSRLPGGGLGPLSGPMGGTPGGSGGGYGPHPLNVNGYHGRVEIGGNTYDVYAQQLAMSPFQQLMADISAGLATLVPTSAFASTGGFTGLGPLYGGGPTGSSGGGGTATAKSQSGSGSTSVLDVVAGTNYFVGAGALAVEYTPGTIRMTKAGQLSPGYYASGWRGGSPARIRTYSLKSIGSGIGRGTIVAGLAMDVASVSIYAIDPGSPYATHPAKGALNIGMGGVSFYNPFAGLLYFGVDIIYPGGWPAAMARHDRITTANQVILGDDWNPYRMNGGLR